MNILSINLGSFFSSKELLESYCHDKKIDIVCIQETFEHKVKPNLPGWIPYTKPRKSNPSGTNPHGGVAIIGRSSTKLTYSKINSTCPDIEIVCCETYIENQKVLLICVYILDQQSMDKLCLWLHKIDFAKYPNILLFGDFNAHHTFWDPKLYLKKMGEGDTLGKTLFTCININNFKILNDKKPTCRQGNNVIDLAMVKGLHDCQIVCYTDPFPILSTIHNPIITKVGKPINNIKVKYNTKLSEEELSKWKITLERRLQEWKNKFTIDITSEEKREDMCRNFVEEIELSVKSHFKQKSICKYSKPWMNSSIKKAIKNFRRAKRISTKRDNPTTKEEFLKAQSHLQNLIQCEVQNHWSNFQNETASLSQQNFWKKITNFVNPRTFQAVQPIYDKESNDLVWDDKQILEKLTNVHIKRTHVEEEYNFDENFKKEVEIRVKEILSNIDKDKSKNKVPFLGSEITQQEIFEAIDNLNGSGSPGPPQCDSNDPGLPPIILKLGRDVIGPFLFLLIKILWEHGEFPKCLKKDTKIFIPKPDKDDYSREKSYRMLTLSPCIAKIYDSVFSARFYKWLEHINFDDDQYAYRKHLSCQTAMFKFIQTVQENLNKTMQQ